MNAFPSTLTSLNLKLQEAFFYRWLVEVVNGGGLWNWWRCMGKLIVAAVGGGSDGDW